jgi:hypothetical protein
MRLASRRKRATRGSATDAAGKLASDKHPRPMMIELVPYQHLAASVLRVCVFPLS